MQWLQGELRLAPDSDRLELPAPGRRFTFRCGDPLEIRVDGRWLRGRVEWSDRLEWYWTDNTMNRRLLPGDEARVWDGRCWPPLRREGPGLER